MPGIFDPGIFDSGIFDTPSGGTTFTRTAADSLSTLTEAATRVESLVRTDSDSLSSITESPSRVATYTRTVSASLSSITEAVVASTNFISRTVSDSISTLTESASRALTLSRSLADSLSTLTEAVTKAAAHPRTIADSVSTLTEAVVRIRVLHRTVADSISSISTAVTRVVSLVRGAADQLLFLYEAVLGSTPYVPPVGPPGIIISVGGTAMHFHTGLGLTLGTNYYSDVLFETARFESQVNGVAGSCYFRVRDDDRTKSFTVGQEILLQIDGTTEWRGFVADVKRVYVMDAYNVDDFGLSRFIDIDGTDINILFTKRIAFNQSTPANIYAPLLPPHTPDIVAIQDLLAGWLDLSGDNLDTTMLVEPVADTTWTQEGRAWEGSDTWGQAMASIAALPAAIFYIDPDRRLVYTDVDTPNAPFALSDQPNHTTSFGYREMEVLMDGTNLANDVMCWGIGYGSQTPVFVRDIDATSVSTHGLWQLGQTTFGVYLQSTIDRIADSILNGSPQSKRGAKNDRPAVQVVTNQRGLRVGQKVDFTSAVFGYEDVIPIRKMTIEFQGPETPKYSLVLSHEIDTPFGFFDPFLFDWHFPKLQCPPGFTMLNGTCVPVSLPHPGGCTDCGITDTFSRTTVSPAIGTADCGLDYTGNLVGTTTLHANGSSAIITSQYGTGNPQVSATLSPFGPDWSDAATHSIQFSMDNFGDAGIAQAEKLEFRLQVGGNSAPVLRVVILPSNSSLWLQGAGPTPSASAYSQITFTSDFISGTQIPISFWSAGTVYTVSTYTSGGFLYGTISDGSATYTTLIGSIPTVITQISFVYTRASVAPFTTSVVNTVTIDNLTVPEVTRCDLIQFDIFNRTVATGWGTASPDLDGHAYTTSDDSNTSVVAASGTNVGYGRAVLANTFRFLTLAAPGPWNATDGFVVTFAFRTDNKDSSGPVFDLFTTDNNLDISYGMRTNGYVDIGTDNFNNEDFITGLTYLTNTWYKAKVEYRPGDVARAKYWAFGDPEPTAWAVSTLGAAVITGDLTVELGGAVSSTELRFAQLDFDYAGRPCYIVGGIPVPPGSGIPSNAWVCESFTTATTTLTMAHPFLDRSPQVWLNGLLQSQSTYTTDALAGTVTFNSAPPGGSNARVCYWSLA